VSGKAIGHTPRTAGRRLSGERRAAGDREIRSAGRFDDAKIDLPVLALRASTGIASSLGSTHAAASGIRSAGCCCCWQAAHLFRARGRLPPYARFCYPAVMDSWLLLLPAPAHLSIPCSMAGVSPSLIARRRGRRRAVVRVKSFAGSVMPRPVRLIPEWSTIQRWY
jgi:hypothetical protein